MSLNEAVHTENATLLQPDAPRPLLTNGQIAAITIGTTFLFFLTVMMIVCAGEYWKYLHGKKKSPNIRQQQVMLAKYNKQNEPTTNHTNIPSQPDSSFSQSDFITSSVRDTDSSGENNQRQRHSSAYEVTNTSVMYNENFAKSNTFDANFDTNLEIVKLDCVETCEETDVKLQEDMTMVPLILVPCDESVDMESEILCDSVESGGQYMIEADV